MMTSDAISVPGLTTDDLVPQGEGTHSKADEVLSRLVRDHHVIVELLDDPDDDGNLQIRIHGDNQDKIDEVVAEVRSGSQ